MSYWRDVCTKGFLPKVCSIDLEIGRFISKIIKAMWVGDVEIRGSYNVPNKGPYIMVSNHTSWLDLFVLGSLPHEPARIMAHECVMSCLGPISAVFLSKFLGLFTASSSAAKEALAKGENVLICPEGWAFSNGGPPRPFHTGAVRISNAGSYPIVPVSITYGKYPGDWILRYPKHQFLICMLMLPWLRSGAKVVIAKSYMPSDNVVWETFKLCRVVTELGEYDGVNR